MKSFLNYDGPFFQFLCRVADMIIVNVLFLVCSLPVVTIGASLAAMTKVSQNAALDAPAGVVETFFRAFRDDFKQATAAWLIILVFSASLVCDRLLIDAYLTGGLASVLRAVTVALAAGCLAVSCYLFPLMVRYDNTLRQHAVNALVLAVTKLPRTLGMTALGSIPFVMCYFSVVTFLKSLSFWVIIGCGVISFFQSLLMAPVLAQLENRDMDKKEEE